MKRKGLLAFSQEYSNGAYPKPSISSPQSDNLCLEQIVIQYCHSRLRLYCDILPLVFITTYLYQFLIYGVSAIYSIHVFVKCTIVQALRLCTGRTAHRGSTGIALLFHDHGTRRG